MKTYGPLFCAVLFLTGALLSASAAEQTALVKGDRVNVRGRPSLVGEVITQLRQGEQVTVLEQISLDAPRPGEPAQWSRIRLPANTPVWVFAPYIDADDGTSKVNRLNLRAGPGENFSVLGRIERGSQVKEIRVVNNWMEIEAPDDTHAYVASSFLEILAPAEPAVVAPDLAHVDPTTKTDPEATDPAAHDEDSAPQPVVVDADTPLAVAPGTETEDTAPLVTTPVEEEEITPEELPRRVVVREGRVIISRSIQAPTEYALESLQTRRTINYVHSEDLGVNLKVYAGRKVIVTGEELIDRRWTNTPIIEVESIRLIP
jgi:uncharacterized protein YgiM (DUF1202 family)